jgi:hypothetical protein
LLLLLAGLHSAAWWIVTGRLLDGFPAVVASAAQAGWRIEAGPPARAGWPWAATMLLPSVSVSRQLGGTILQWTAKTVRVTLSATAPSVLSVSPDGAETLAVGPDNALPLHAASAELRIPLAGGAAPFEVTGLTLSGPGGTGVRADRITGTIQPLAVGLTADGVTIAPPLARPFDGPLAFSIGITASAPFPDAASPGASAAAWQAAQGRITVPAMTVRWGAFHLTGSGAGGLDAQLQPFAQANLQVEGAPQVLDALGRAGLVAPGPASAARAVFGLLALAAKGGPVPLPVSLADRTLTVAQFPLVRLPLLDWNLP